MTTAYDILTTTRSLSVGWWPIVTIIAAAGCGSTPTRTFEPSQYELVKHEWGFQSRPGTQLTTDHFEIYTTSEDSDFVAFLPNYLETTYQFYASLLPPSADHDGQKLETYILADRHEWDAFVKRRYPGRYHLYRMISAGGFSEGRACVVYDIGRVATLSVIAHEGLHQYFGAHFSEPLPAWLNEGLATYCESVEFRRDVPYFKPQHNSFRINHLRHAVAADDTMPLMELLATNAGNVIEGNQMAATASYYAQAWALIVYLRHGAGGKYAEGFREMLDGIADGTIRIKARAAKATSPSPSTTAYGQAVFYAYITQDVETFEADFRAYCEHLCFKN